MDEIKDFFNKFFDTGNFPPRWHCGKWSDFHGWMYIISDLAIWAAYFTIPFLLIHFILRKKDVPFPKIFWLFGGFILACGATHLIDAIIFWVPLYRLSAFVRLITAIISWATIYSVYKILPDAFALKSPAELERQVNERTKQLNLSMLKTRFLADAMPQIVWTARPDGSGDYFNQRALKFTGRKMGALLEWKWLEILHPDDREAHEKKWQSAITNPSEFEMESRILGADGKYYWHLSRALPQLDEHGNVLLWVGTATDIELQKKASETLERKVGERTEELRRVNEELLQSNSDLEQFAAVASHDLQAPLRTISMYLDMISENPDNVIDAQSVKFLSKGIETAKRMRRLIENLLTYSQVNATRLNPSATDLNAVLGIVAANIEDLIQSKKAQLVYDSLPVVYGDETQLIQLLQNFVSNGMNYNNNASPTITVTATEDENFHTITVTDNGNGIEEANLSKVFELFTRLESDKTGTGLGLSICKKIVEKHRGSIWVTSENGKGSSFYFTLPKAPDKL